MSVTVNGTNGLTFNDGSSQQTAASGFGFKNRIINGDFRIDQRNAGASVTPAGGAYTLDRWTGNTTAAGKYTVQQNAGAVTPPVGFSKYLGVTSTSAYSVAAGDALTIYQAIEGNNIADLNWGTANAKTVTLSFVVYSSLTGTFGGAIQNGAVNRSYPFTYTISSANTWTTVSVTIAGDTTGTWTTDNSSGLRIVFGLGCGSTYSGTAGSWAGAAYYSATGATSVVGTNGATFYITGVQLEKGSTATSFDYRPYGTELALCQRYYCKSYDIGVAPGTSTFVGSMGFNGRQIRPQAFFPVFLRADPTVVLYNPQSGASGYVYNSGASTAATAAEAGQSSFTVTGAIASGTDNDCRAHWTASAEL